MGKYPWKHGVLSVFKTILRKGIFRIELGYIVLYLDRNFHKMRLIVFTLDFLFFLFYQIWLIKFGFGSYVLILLNKWLSWWINLFTSYFHKMNRSILQIKINYNYWIIYQIIKLIQINYLFVIYLTIKIKFNHLEILKEKIIIKKCMK